MTPEIIIKRVYDPADLQDGVRVLVDRIWPRGMTKEKVNADLWLKDAAPSSDLRKWFCHDSRKWEQFIQAYSAELDGKPEVIDQLLKIAENSRLTLLYASREPEFNQAVVLREYLLAHKK